MALIGLLVPFAAAGGWLWWIRQSDRFEREPWGLIFTTFGTGAAAGLLGLIGLIITILMLPEEASSLGTLLLVPIHVLLMTGVIYGVPYRKPDWNEPFDGLVYGGATGIGYGLTYTLLSFMEGPMAGFRTAVYSMPTFMLAGLIIGHYLSQLRFGAPDARAAAWWRALSIPALALLGIELARTFGGDVMGIDNPVASAIVYGANTIGWIVAMWAMDAKHRRSQFNITNYRLPLADTACGTCGSAHITGANFCNQCGHSLALRREEHRA